MCGTEPGSIETYREQVPMPLNGKVRMIDRCISHVVAALNAGGVETVACCCGHGKQPGRIDLADGRVLVISSTRDMLIADLLNGDLAYSKESNIQ